MERDLRVASSSLLNSSIPASLLSHWGSGLHSSHPQGGRPNQAAAGAGPAWNAGTGCAPGLLWKLAAGDGGGGGGGGSSSQRVLSGRSGGGGGPSAQTPACRTRTASASAPRTSACGSLPAGEMRPGAGAWGVGRGGGDRGVGSPGGEGGGCAKKPLAPGLWDRLRCGAGERIHPAAAARVPGRETGPVPQAPRSANPRPTR
ncbi:alanine and glycine-rich protein-like [Erinaceus europaeus]|uniref:Alanine and glycine-rich protein-like n=1 Tax=Erinaceus europaeus TaxID=9365 RepID=A0ABM3YBA3_ERIEU|nr:alanine and glycine-rich protein-like [Erinaceus europaeus]